jgi:hypothetical protein
MRNLLNVHSRIVSGLSSLQSPMLLAVRLYWGFQFAQTGWGKLHNLAKITAFFGSLNIPAPRFCCSRRFTVGVRRRYPSYAWSIFAPHRISPRLQHVRRILDRGPRRAHVGLFRPGQVLYRRSAHLPLRVVDGLNSRSGFLGSRYADRQTSESC